MDLHRSCHNSPQREHADEQVLWTNKMKENKCWWANIQRKAQESMRPNCLPQVRQYQRCILEQHNHKKRKNRLVRSYPCPPRPAGKIGLKTFADVSMVPMTFCTCKTTKFTQKSCRNDKDVTEITDGMAPVRYSYSIPNRINP